MDTAQIARQQSMATLRSWIDSCTRSNRVTKNTIGIGIVVLDHLRSLGVYPKSILQTDVITSYGEIRGTYSALGATLAKYGIPKRYLKEITARKAHQDGQRLFEAFEWGNWHPELSAEEKDKLWLDLAQQIKSYAHEWFRKARLRPALRRRQAPAAWVDDIIEAADGRSGGVVEMHLVGAVLEKRFGRDLVENHPAHAADKQTARFGDFTIAGNVYHVTAAPGQAVIDKCIENVRSGLRPILLVPEKYKTRAKALSEVAGVDGDLVIIAIEDFISLNLIEIAIQESGDAFSVLREMIEVYNRRLSEVETDLSLKIELR